MSKTKGKSILYGIKFHVPSKGQLGNNNIWRIYNELDKGIVDTTYVEHVEILGVPTWTGEAIMRIGFSLICEGQLTVDYDPDSGYKYAVISDGTYEQRYNENLEEL